MTCKFVYTFVASSVLLRPLLNITVLLVVPTLGWVVPAALPRDPPTLRFFYSSDDKTSPICYQEYSLDYCGDPFLCRIIRLDYSNK